MLGWLLLLLVTTHAILLLWHWGVVLLQTGATSLEQIAT